ncbi:hypothetical protein ADUPG1_012287 [Aduncisulcus paluster]|uniref:Uncharacterized protein n=1 Tax=Aduncisulcus paluster TaxID=2918883 RepID=A0ABQ5JYY6_9EUKA|nr:hypothetical protein ADUPG1_012286 [Aduncisulcus paluster]GKT22979.1 hypothetical protein ADUPG1_012287 [Aduncisulcus paluster]
MFEREEDYRNDEIWRTCQDPDVKKIENTNSQNWFYTEDIFDKPPTDISDGRKARKNPDLTYCDEWSYSDSDETISVKNDILIS